MEGKLDIKFVRNVAALLALLATIFTIVSLLSPRPVELAPDKEKPMIDMRAHVESLEVRLTAHEAKAEVLKAARDQQLNDLKELVTNQHREVIEELHRLRREASIRSVAPFAFPAVDYRQARRRGI